jgi:hypothetical protein
MSEKSDTDRIRISQVASGALAAVTAAVLGSTMGVAGTVAGAGLASVVTTVGGTLYMRSIRRTKESVRSVRNLVVTRVGGTDATLVEERRIEPAPEPDTPTSAEPTETTMEQAAAAVGKEAGQDGDDQPPAWRRLRWPALIAASALAFVLGMLVITGVELLRGEQMSGGNGTTIGRIAQTEQDDGDNPDKAPPPSQESTTPPGETPTETATPTAPTSENEETEAPPSEPTEPEPTEPDTTTNAPPAPTESVPQGGEAPPAGEAG